MKIRTLVVGYLETNCYLLSDDVGDTAVIDPGAGAGTILRAIDEASLRPRAIILTHTHSDHIGALEAVRKQWNLPVLLSAEEADFLRVPADKRKPYTRGAYPEPFFITLKHGDIIDIGDLAVKVLLTPGHTPGGICLLCGGTVFTGDTLFNEGIGRTDLNGGSFDSIIISIKNHLLTLPDDTQALPGHGPATTIGRERDYFK